MKRLLLYLITAQLLSSTAILYSQNLASEDSLSNKDLYDLILAAKEEDDAATLAKAYWQLAENDLHTIDNSDRAINSYRTSIEYYAELGDSTAYYAVKSDLGRLYAEEDYYEEALLHFGQTLSYYTRQKDSTEQARMLSQISDLHLAKGNRDLAVEYLENARQLNLRLQDTLTAMINRITLSTLTDGDNDGVTDSLLTEIAVQDTLKNIDYKSSVLLNLGTYYSHLGKHQMALYFLQKGELTSDERSAQRRDLFKGISETYKAMGNYQLALAYYQKYSELNDFLLNERRVKIINNLLIRHQASEKSSQIRELEKDNRIAEMLSRSQTIMTISLLIGSFIILVGTYLVIRNYQVRLNTNQIIGQQNEEINKRRITDLENNLKIETMHSMIMGQEAERERIAKDLHDSLGGLLSTVKLHFDALQTRDPSLDSKKEYQRAYKLLDIACEEVRNISNNFQPGALLKLGIVPAINDMINRLQTGVEPHIDFQHYDVNGAINQTTALNIYRIVQELLNNSIKHAKASEVLVQLIQKEDEIMLMVEDDGVGYDTMEVKKGMGTENIASRVNFLKGDLSIHSEKGTGTTTMISIPISAN